MPEVPELGLLFREFGKELLSTGRTSPGGLIGPVCIPHVGEEVDLHEKDLSLSVVV